MMLTGNQFSLPHVAIKNENQRTENQKNSRRAEWVQTETMKGSL